MLEKQWIRRIERRLAELRLPVDIHMPDGSVLNADSAARVRLILRSPKALQTLADPSMGALARCYVEQEMDVEGEIREVVGLSEVLTRVGENAENGGGRGRIRKWMRHSRLFDRKAIRHHYDIDDEFYGLWLDSRRVYSCGYFRHADDTLEEAQQQKLDHICRKLALAPGERFLDIGCGWGALIIWAAKHYKVRATGITLSENQYAYASKRIGEERLGDLCSVHLLDYRDVLEEDPYDKIASVGMVEHVGRKNLPLYFSKIRRLLRPGGILMNHGITLNNTGRDELGSDIGKFIDEYVFPGGELCHVADMAAAMSGEGLEVHDCESLRPHYARTLWHWVERLDANRERAVARVGEKAYRVWRIYMAGSAHAFERGWMSIFQVLSGRADGAGRLGIPPTRDYVYRG